MNPSENKMRGRRENRAAAMQFAYMRAANKDVPLNQLLDSFFETKEEPRETVFRQNTLTGAVLRDISRNTFQKISTAMHWMVSSITIPADR